MQPMPPFAWVKAAAGELAACSSEALPSCRSADILSRHLHPLRTSKTPPMRGSLLMESSSPEVAHRPTKAATPSAMVVGFSSLFSHHSCEADVNSLYQQLS